MTPPAPAAICWRLEQWPRIDQLAWAHALAPGDPFDDPSPAAGLREATLITARKSYGRWLSFLASRGWLDPDERPLNRVTHPRLRTWLRSLKAAGNASATIRGRFDGLARALRILTPGADTAWVRCPDGASLRALLPDRPGWKPAPDSAVLLEWGLELMNTPEEALCPIRRLTRQRDGLLIALLAVRGRRRRSWSLLRFPEDIRERDGVFHVDLKPYQVKTKKSDRFTLPEELTPYIQHYLQNVRPSLLGDSACDAFFVNAKGGRLSEKSITQQIEVRARERFGHVFGPHRFRHAIATTAALHAPDHEALGAEVLAITPAIAEAHYIRAGQITAIRAHQTAIAARRRRLERDLGLIEGVSKIGP